ncbi:purine-nucleoside phosphorylase, partial [Enterococcus faecalis]|nr:purine-nucleoside phosphorylase [Enterococcus faecalis]
FYYLAAIFYVEPLATNTVCGSFVKGEETTGENRLTTFNEMIEFGLETAIAN